MLVCEVGLSPSESLFWFVFFACLCALIAAATVRYAFGLVLALADSLGDGPRKRNLWGRLHGR